jgi:acyl-CoA synthetase (NDP forming)
MNKKRLKEFQPIFYPRSIAVMGASQDNSKPGSMFLAGLVEAGFRGELYPINPKGGEILGLKAYPNLKSVPNLVDYVILAVPRAVIPAAIDDCIAKRVKAIKVLASGFAEGGTEGEKLEREMVSRARSNGVRLIGPNCIGVYSPRHLMPYGPGEHLLGEIGSVAFVSQSGGQGANLIGEGIRRGIRFSKGIHYGNGADLNESDFLEYLAVDPETEIIAAYIEGVKDGQRFLQVLRQVAKRKPVVVWKGGRTEAGARATLSHTGSLAGSEKVWTAVLKEAGAIKVESAEELADTLLAFQNLPPLRQVHLAVIGGLADGAGGFSVAATDTCASRGLNIPPFSAETRNQLEALISPIGTILNNPIDTGGAVVTDLKVFQQMFKIVVADIDTNLVLLNQAVDPFLTYIPNEVLYALNDTVIELSSKKPFVIVSPASFAETEQLAMERKFARAKLPVYPTLERAAKAIANFTKYWEFRRELDVG